MIVTYDMLCTRPEIANATSVTRRYYSNPSQLHWKNGKDILKYLWRTKELFIANGGANLKIEAYNESSSMERG